MMDEPMEAEADSTQPDLNPEEKDDQSNKTPLLRPGNMVMMTITTEDYESLYWPKLEGAINQLLTMSPGQYMAISYEQMYSCVYKCVCKQFSDRLYTDLMNHMIQHLKNLNQQLQSSMHVENSKSFLEKFSFLVNQYILALGGIVPIFNYMNRFYVETKLKTDLNEELKKLFKLHILDHHISVLLTLLEEANAKPFTISPPVMANTIKNIHSINPEYAKMKPELFAKFIPSILPQTSVTDLDRYIEEAQQIQRDLKVLPDFDSCPTRKKRTNEDDGRFTK
ncbi:CDK2-associated and cullin domain-containing protein 1-like [Pecten maximus]|uniref:CDK2-associated and cullin domain-containing protein 1-like n=1 Tax=Pecten maximus TaxID=6579 RepID=UPI0014582A03|nr:CDK2-associated and cullin domain-containing protein 1-like [Pecten maximus]